jgi:squalene-hopene/tetraprenyl-beta-curcumene cyclase
MSFLPDSRRVVHAYHHAKEVLLAERNAAGIWVGELSSSALSTATAVVALELVRRAKFPIAAPEGRSGLTAGQEPPQAGQSGSPQAGDRALFAALIAGGLQWLARQQNADGGWGDTTRSISNISTTMLCHAAFHAAGAQAQYAAVVDSAKACLDRMGGVPAVRARYGKDKTFSIPILTHCALAGLVDWREVAPLPFELACLPARFYKWVRLPVVSYALPALIAIGQVRHHFVKPRNPLTRAVRAGAIETSLRILERIQPEGGGFLEATPLTSFVTMSLAGMGRADHLVARRGVEFLIRSARPDGSWPIDTNLATWVTTLSINALGADLPPEAINPLRRWLCDQQYRDVHPYTNAEPGGWAWTDLPGGVPDGDDTPGAILALLGMTAEPSRELVRGIRNGTAWLLDLQNRDGGWPTFCRGWGTLPFDRSAPDLTAHTLRALSAEDSLGLPNQGENTPRQIERRQRAIRAGFDYLKRAQRPDGAWLPLWFGNQSVPGDENPVYGTARVLAAYRDTGQINAPPARRGLEWLRQAQNADGGWGGAQGVESSVEETALAADVFLSLETRGAAVSLESVRSTQWLLDRIDQGTWMEPSPIGFYFAKLWYFERLYPLIFTVAALRRAALLVSLGGLCRKRGRSHVRPPGARLFDSDKSGMITPAEKRLVSRNFERRR